MSILAQENIYQNHFNISKSASHYFQPPAAPPKLIVMRPYFQKFRNDGKSSDYNKTKLAYNKAFIDYSTRLAGPIATPFRSIVEHFIGWAYLDKKNEFHL